MASKKVRIEAPIKGVFGETVNVGDKVMVMTTGWGNAYLNKGKYIGYVEGSGYYKQCAQVEIELTGHKRLWNDTKEEFKYGGAREKELYKDYSTYGQKLQEQTHVIQYPYTRISTLKLNRIATLKD